MGLPPKLLGADEYEVIHTRTHAKALVGPALVLIVLGAAVGAGVALVPTEFRPVGQVAVAALGVIPLWFWVVLPFLRWRTTTYTVTNRRLVTRRGVLNKVSLDVPLNRIHEVSQERSLSDRMFGCGTLQIQTAAEDGLVVLADVPEVEHVHAEMTGLLFGSPAWSSEPEQRP